MLLIKMEKFHLPSIELHVKVNKNFKDVVKRDFLNWNHIQRL